MQADAALAIAPAPVRAQLTQALTAQQGAATLSEATALDLIRLQAVLQAQTRAAALAPALVATEEHRRFVIDDALRIPAGGGVVLSAQLARPRAATAPLPAAMLFTIYTDPPRTGRRCCWPPRTATPASWSMHAARARAAAPCTLRTRRRGRQRGHRLDQPPAMERWPGRHVWRQLRGLHCLGGGAPSPSRIEDHRALRCGHPRPGPADGEQRVPECQLRLGVLCGQWPDAGQRYLRSERALVAAAAPLVCLRAPLPADRPGRWHAQPLAATLAGPSVLRCLLARRWSPMAISSTTSASRY